MSAAIASWVQALIYLFTLFVLIRQVSSQRRTLQLAEYIRCQTDFTETYRLLVQSQLHSEIYDELAAHGSKFVSWNKYTKRQKLTYAYLELLYEIFERVFVLYKKNWISADEWRQWEVWMKDVMHHPIFNDVCKDSIGMFDPVFEKEVLKNLPKQPTLKNKQKK